MSWIVDAMTIQDKQDTWALLARSNNVKISFFGDIGFGGVSESEYTSDGALQVASFVDLMATKLKVILQRAECKDYRDIAAMLNHNVNLAEGLGAARAMFGPNFQPHESLKALGYFGDGDLDQLSADERKVLLLAVHRIDTIPDMGIQSKTLCLDTSKPYHQTRRP